MSEIRTVAIKQLGLAAYLKSNGCELLKVEDKSFYFETDKTVKEWYIKYSNSCCFHHDSSLCELRKLLNC